MKVILIKNVSKLGRSGEIKDVADGFARNFLFPNGLAVAASDGNMEKLKTAGEQKEKAAVRELNEVEKIAARLEGMVLEIKGRVNEGGKLYAAITPSTIVKKLKDSGIGVNKDQVFLPEIIKEVGEYQVTVNLEHGLEASITVIAEEQ